MSVTTSYGAPKPGDLRYKVDIVQPDDSVDDGYGEPGTSTVVASVWADVHDLSGLEIVRAQLIADKATHVVIIRYDSTIQSSMRVVYEGRTFHIQAVLDEGKPYRKFWLHLLCWEVESI